MSATEADLRTLAVIRSFIEERGYPPSVRDIASALGYSSSQYAHVRVKRLADLGLIRRDPKVPRSIVVLEAS